MLLLCCNLLSLAEGGSTTVVAWGVHLPSTCHCSVIVRHHVSHIRHRNGRRNTQKSETIAEVHGNSASICRVFWARSFRLSSGSTHISRFKHRCAAPPCVLRFWCFLLSLLRHARQRLYGFLAPYYFRWLPVLTSLRSTFTLKRSFLFLLRHLLPCRSLCGRCPAPPTSSPTPLTFTRFPTPDASNTMTSVIIIPRLSSTSMRMTRLWTNGSLFWAPSPTQSLIQLIRAWTTTSSSHCSFVLSSRLRKFSASMLASLS